MTEPTVVKPSTGSFAEFFHEVEPRLRRALGVTLGVDDGADATAEALAYGWQHWDRVQQMENPAGYLYRIGRNSMKRRPRVQVLSNMETVPTPWIEPRLPAALDRLSERQRTSVLLVHSFGWTYAEVATLLGVSIGTVETHVTRGIRKLRLAIGEEP